MGELIVPKKPWQSRTNWAALIVAASAFVPAVHDWVVANPEMYSMLLGGLFAGLRFITKGKIEIL